ncbi:MAG TPA: glucokinase, partial [Vitreoscilla sp.]|nr:glucokinase [Vitreoscilla sp.]
MTTAPFSLVADIGGTHARFALEVQPLELHHVMVLASENFASMEAAINHYVTSVGQPRIQHAAFAMANPVLGDVVQMTNHHWTFSIASMRLAMGWETLLVVNDFSAQ